MNQETCDFLNKICEIPYIYFSSEYNIYYSRNRNGYEEVYYTDRIDWKNKIETEIMDVGCNTELLLSDEEWQLPDEKQEELLAVRIEEEKQNLRDILNSLLNSKKLLKDIFNYYYYYSEINDKEIIDRDNFSKNYYKI